jgi:hypothetical protein
MPASARVGFRWVAHGPVASDACAVFLPDHHHFRLHGTPRDHTNTERKDTRSRSCTRSEWITVVDSLTEFLKRVSFHIFRRHQLLPLTQPNGCRFAAEAVA